MGAFGMDMTAPAGRGAPKANAAYWAAKIARNRARDRLVRHRLKREGWRALVIWECELRDLSAVS